MAIVYNVIKCVGICSDLIKWFAVHVCGWMHLHVYTYIHLHTSWLIKVKTQGCGQNRWMVWKKIELSWRLKLWLLKGTWQGKGIGRFILILLRFACVLWWNLYLELLYLRCHEIPITWWWNEQLRSGLMNAKYDDNPQTHLTLEFKVMNQYTYIYYDNIKFQNMSLDFWQWWSGCNAGWNRSTSIRS